MPMLGSPNYIAGGNINPSVFVSITGNMTVSQSTANDGLIVGVSQPGTDFPPGVGSGSTLAAKSGETLQVYGPGETCLLKVTNAVTAGQFMNSDANGQGVVITSGATVSYFGAKTLEAANAGELCRVLVVLGGITTS